MRVMLRIIAFPRWMIAVGCVTAALVTSVGCGSDTSGPTTPDVLRQVWQLRLSSHAITLALSAPGNQVQLVATPLAATGDTLVTDAKTIFTSNDTSVLVDSTGLLTAHSKKTGVKVFARMTVRNARGEQVTLSDTAVVNVNAVASVPEFSHLVVTTPGDSAQFFPSSGAPTVSALDAMSKPIAGVVFFFEEVDSTGYVFKRGTSLSFLSGNPGTTELLRVEADVYGVQRTDSILVTNSYPDYAVVMIDTLPRIGAQPVGVYSVQPTILLSVTGVVGFRNRSERQVDIVFDDPTAAETATATSNPDMYFFGYYYFKLPGGSGNLLLPPADSTNFTDGVGEDLRWFPRPGTFPYHSNQYSSLHGSIVVQ